LCSWFWWVWIFFRECSFLKRARASEELLPNRTGAAIGAFMQVEKLKYIIWAKDMERAVRFYCEVFDAKIMRQSDVMAELSIAGSLLGIHGGGEGKRTWTGLSFQVGDLFSACDALRAGGGLVLREPQDTPEEPAHLAMCADTEGNEIMLTRQRRN
jgi:predicted enzyme related to lactoylglutathione lyase